jgi:uncharacterized protein (DUF433 family)
MPKTPVVHSHPEIMGGTPVFVGTRVPVQALLDFLIEGDSIHAFLDGFPTVTREQWSYICSRSHRHIRAHND